MAELLIQHGANVNVVRSGGVTPLISAVQKGKPTHMFLIIS